MRSLQKSGFTLLEALIAFGISAIIVGVGLLVLNGQAHAFSRVSARTAGTFQIDAVVAQLDESAHSSVAIYVPQACGTNTCTSLRFYGKDSSGTAHYWGWDYNAATKSLSQCLSYGASESTCAQPGATIPNVLAFQAAPTSAQTLATRYGLGAVANVTRQVSNDAQIVAGNRVMVVNIATAWAQRETHLLQEGAPFSAAVLKGSFTPPTLGPAVLSAIPAPVWFEGTTAAAASAGANETSYSQYEPFIPVSQWWRGSNNACLNATWNTSNVPSDSTTFSLQPTAIGACSFTVASYDQISNSIPAYVAGPLAPIVNGTVQSSMTLGYGGTGSVGGGKTYDADENGNITNMSITGCSTVLTLGSPTYSFPATPDSSYGYKELGVTGSGVGNCTMTISNGFDVPQSIAVQVNGILTTSCPLCTLLYPSGGGTAPTQATLSVSEPGYSGAFTVSGNTCGGEASVSGFSSNGPNAIAIVTGIAPGGTCAVTVSGLNAASSSVPIQVNPNATPTPSPTPAGMLTFNPNPVTVPQSGTSPFTANDTMGPVTTLTQVSTTCNSTVAFGTGFLGNNIWGIGATNGYSCSFSIRDNFGNVGVLVANVSGSGGGSGPVLSCSFLCPMLVTVDYFAYPWSGWTLGNPANGDPQYLSYSIGFSLNAVSIDTSRLCPFAVNLAHGGTAIEGGVLMDLSTGTFDVPLSDGSTWSVSGSWFGGADTTPQSISSALYGSYTYPHSSWQMEQSAYGTSGKRVVQLMISVPPGIGGGGGYSSPYAAGNCGGPSGTSNS